MFVKIMLTISPDFGGVVPIFKTLSRPFRQKSRQKSKTDFFFCVFSEITSFYIETKIMKSETDLK